MWHEFRDEDQYTKALSHHISTSLQAHVDEQGTANLAVSGGRSPIALFEQLSRADIDWGNVHIALVDERVVAPGSADSNECLVRTHLLSNRAACARFSGLVSNADDLAGDLQRANGQTQHIDLAILGMGGDGHTASLFPGASQLAQALDPGQKKRYIHISPPDASYERISMTLAALLAAGELILAISGLHKRQVFDQAAQQANPALPISYLITQAEVPFHAYWHP